MRRVLLLLFLCAALGCEARIARSAESMPSMDSLSTLVRSSSIDDHHRAEKWLTRHLRRTPADVPAALLLGDLYVLQHRPSEARSAYRKVVRVAPENRHARRELGLLRAREWAQMFDRSDRERAIDDLARGVPPADSAFTDADWSGLAVLAVLLCDAHLPRRALAALDAPLRAHEDAGAWVRLAHAVALHANGDIDSAATEYATGIRLLGPLDRDGYIDVRPVADTKTKAEFSALALEDRAAWLPVFWKHHDPTPTTPVNEFQLEFYRRVTCAFLFFRLPDTRWWDARGDVYVRFGAPDVVDTVEGRLINVEHDYDMGDVIIPDQIVWRYPQYGMDVRLAETISPQVYTFPFPTSATKTNPYLNVIVGRYLRQREASRKDFNWDPAEDFVRARALRGEQRAEQVLDAGGFLVRLDMRKNVIPFASASASFRGDGGYVRHAVTIGVLRDALANAAREQEHKRGALDTVVGDTTVIEERVEDAAPRRDGRLVATAVLLDGTFREVARAESRGPFATIATPDGPMQVARLDLFVAPGHYYLATSVEDSAAVGAHRTGVNAPGSANALTLSDVEVQVPVDGAPGVRITQPANVLANGQQLAIAFEAYNLTRDIRGRARATIRCSVEQGDDLGRTSQRRRGGLITRTPVRGTIATEFPDEVRSSTLERTIDLNIDKLEPGEYTATITVTDAGSDAVATARTTFVKSASFPRR